MRIATWNIKGVGARKECLLRWLEERKPDVVALQKVGAKAKFPSKELARAGYCACPLYAKYGLGVAVLSRSKLVVAPDQVKTQPELGESLLMVEIDGLSFASVYAPTGEGGIESKLDWYARLTKCVTQSRCAQLVLCGDFNVVTETRVTPEWRPPRDSRYDGKRARKAFSGLLDAKLADLYGCRPLNGDSRFIFDGDEGRFRVSRMEFILGTRAVVDRLRGVWVDIDHRIKDDFNSWDRAPIVADLDD